MQLPLKWVAGLYYSDQWIHNTNFQQIPGINAAFKQIFGFSLEQSPVNDFFGGPGISRSSRTTSMKPTITNTTSGNMRSLVRPISTSCPICTRPWAPAIGSRAMS